MPGLTCSLILSIAVGRVRPSLAITGHVARSSIELEY